VNPWDLVMIWMGWAMLSFLVIITLFIGVAIVVGIAKAVQKQLRSKE